MYKYFGDGHIELDEDEKDPGERNNIAAADSKIAASRKKRILQNWRQQTNSQPNSTISKL